VRIRLLGREEEEVIRHSATELPGLLQRYGLDPAVERIDLDPDSLETVIVEMIEDVGR
jgi:hypothetical protein